MAALAPIKKTTEETKGHPKGIAAPRASAVKRGKDLRNRPIKIMFFGPLGSGKTFGLADVLRMGNKVFVLSTDLGGEGLITVQNELSRTKELELFDENVWSLELNGFEEVYNFLKDPESVFPDFFKIGIDFFVWEGFSMFQQADIQEYAGEQAGEKALLSEEAGKRTREIPDVRSEGFWLEQQDWGAVRNATIRVMKLFLGLHNPDSRPLHKIVTCHESIKQKPRNQAAGTGGDWFDNSKPLLTGAGGIYTGAGFDLVIKTRVEADTEEGARKFSYHTQLSSTTATKNRGFEIPPVMPANFKTLWAQIQAQLNTLKAPAAEEVTE